MSIERTYYCDGPTCGDDLHDNDTPAHTRTATPPPYLPMGFMEVRQTLPGGDGETLHFCGWDCLMKYAAKQPIPEIVRPGDDSLGSLA